MPPAPHVVVRVAARLAAAGCVAAEEEAALLLAVTTDEAGLEAALRRREQGEPLAWITGGVRFAGCPVAVTPGVYVPRPHTEALARRAVTLLPPGGRAVDLCTGSGAVAVALAASAPGARVVGVDVDPRAAACAARNGVDVVVGDLDAPLRSGAFDVVTAVAPYVPARDLAFLPADVQRWEPHRALDGGGDGLDLVRRLVAAAARLLRPGGWLLTEVGGDQLSRLGVTLAACGFDGVDPWFDEDDELRGLAARKVAHAASGW